MKSVRASVSTLLLAALLILGWSPAPAAVAATKVTAGSVTIVGTAQVAVPLQAAVAGWQPDGLRYSYQWYASGKAIKKATQAAYTPAAGDAGKQLTVKVTGSATGYVSVAVTSAKTAKVLPGTATAGTPTISGDPALGKKLTAKPGSWKPAGMTFSYQWYRAGTAITKATRSSYTAVRDDLSAVLTVRITGKKAGYQTTTATASASVVVGFGAGTFKGSALKPGTYQAPGGMKCDWKRTPKSGGTGVGPLHAGRTIVAIAATDRSFTSSGCGIWRQAPTAQDYEPPYADGDYIIGVQIPPGLYQTRTVEGPIGCYWEINTGWGGTDAEVEDYGWIKDPLSDSDNAISVNIPSSGAVGFVSSGCGSWTPAVG